MNTLPITQTETLWDQKFKLSPNLKAGSDNEARFFVENLATQAKYLLQGWQMALLASFESGQSSVAQCVRETAAKFPTEINEIGVRQFCQWALDEGLAGVVEQPVASFANAEPAQQVQSVASTEGESSAEQINPIAQATLKPEPNPEPKKATVKKSRPSRGNGAIASLVKIAACVVVGIGTWKFTATVLPIVNGASTSHLAVTGNKAVEMHNSSASAVAPALIDVSDGAVDIDGVTEMNSVNRELLLKNLRNELANVQVERDESYDKSDESSYREAVQRIAKITHQIGEIQAEMKAELGTENPGVAYGAGNSINL